MAKKLQKRMVYLDYASTTPVNPAVFKAMQPFFIKNFGNPSALYNAGQLAASAINEARHSIATLLHTQPDTIIFTSGGTESDNLAVFGIARGCEEKEKKKGHIITTLIEHHAVLESVRRLEKEGWQVTYISVDTNGFVKSSEVIKALRPDTALVSIMYANNEIGTIEPIAEIGRELMRYRKAKNSLYPYFHTDACQAAGYLDLDVEKLHVDLMALNGSKIYGPKGVGLLYVRRGVLVKPLMYGGSQEWKKRAGTENVPGIIGLAKALELSQKSKARETERSVKLTEYFWKELQKKNPNIQLNGPEIGGKRLPNNLNIRFPDVEGEKLVIYLNEYGIMCSTGSACNAHSTDPSHVLKAIGLTSAEAKNSIRFTLGEGTTKQGVAYAADRINQLMKQKYV